MVEMVQEVEEEQTKATARITIITIKAGNISTFRKSPSLQGSLLSMDSSNIMDSTVDKLTDSLL
jgi:hypothetical protein